MLGHGALDRRPNRRGWDGQPFPLRLLCPSPGLLMPVASWMRRVSPCLLLRGEYQDSGWMASCRGWAGFTKPARNPASRSWAPGRNEEGPAHSSEGHRWQMPGAYSGPPTPILTFQVCPTEDHVTETRAVRRHLRFPSLFRQKE